MFVVPVPALVLVNLNRLAVAGVAISAVAGALARMENLPSTTPAVASLDICLQGEGFSQRAALDALFVNVKGDMRGNAPLFDSSVPACTLALDLVLLLEWTTKAARSFRPDKPTRV